MDEINTTSTINNTSKSATVDQVNVEANTKRRPDQVLYKPPRRSKNLESPTPISAPTSTEDVQTSSNINKTTKSKTTRPSVEPYVPPSRRSQTTTSKEPTVQSSTSTQPPLQTQTSIDENKKNDDEDDEDDWEKLLDNSLNNDLAQEIQTKFKNSLHIKKPTNDYAEWSIQDIQLKEGDFAHVVEVSNFPSSFHTEDLFTAFQTLTRSKFDIKWVDETHALIVFSDANMALDVLQIEHPMFKLCSMSQASAASKKKAKNTSEFLQPFKTRPETSSLTANRQICAALGLKNPMGSDKTRMERQKLQTAKQQKTRDKEEQKAVWDGAVLPATSTT